MSQYPALRMRRLRRHDWTRRLVAENRLSVDDLIWPVFVIEGSNTTTDVGSMPDVQRVTIDGTVFHRVQIGPTTDLDALNRMRGQLRDAGIDALVRRARD